MNKRASGSLSPSGYVVLALTGLYLADLFLPWQRVCISGALLGRFISACVSGTAFQATASGFGVASGLFAAALVAWLALTAAGIDLGSDSNEIVERVLSWGVVGTGATKWIMVLGKAAAVGAFLGVAILIALAAAATVRMQSPRSPITHETSPPPTGGWVNW